MKGLINLGRLANVMNVAGGPLPPPSLPHRDSGSEHVGAFLADLSRRRSRSRNTHRHKRGRKISS